MKNKNKIAAIFLLTLFVGGIGLYSWNQFSNSKSNEVKKGDKILEIGTGCGYQAAILGQVSKEVYSIERIQGLYEKAKENLRPMRLPNIHLILGDGMLGFEQGAPYAGIISAAGGENIPPAWLEQLAVGGRLVAPVANAQGSQVLVVIDKMENSYKRSFLEPVHFVPLRSGVA